MLKTMLKRKFMCILPIVIVTMLVIVTTATAYTDELVFRDGTSNALVTNYNGTHDTFLYGHPSYPAWQTYNHGATSGLMIDSDPTEFIIKFTGLSVLAGQYISIDEVFITLYTSGTWSGPTFNADVRQIANNNADWIEGTGTAWNSVALTGEPSFDNRVTPTVWNGGDGALGGSVSIGTMAIDPHFSQYTLYNKLVPNALVEQWITGVNAGLIFKHETGVTSNVAFYSSENGAVNYRPAITIRYTAIPEPATMVLLGLGSLLIRRKK